MKQNNDFLHSNESEQSKQQLGPFGSQSNSRKRNVNYSYLKSEWSNTSAYLCINHRTTSAWNLFNVQTNDWDIYQLKSECTLQLKSTRRGERQKRLFPMVRNRSHAPLLGWMAESRFACVIARAKCCLTGEDATFSTWHEISCVNLQTDADMKDTH